MYYLKVKAGKHWQSGRFYRPGEIVSEPIDLSKRFPKRFERVENPDLSPSPEVAENQDTAKEGAGIGEIPAPSAFSKPFKIPSGKDVSKKFPLAKKLRLKVFKEGKTYNIYEVSLGNKKQLDFLQQETKATKVNAYLSSLMEA